MIMKELNYFMPLLKKEEVYTTSCLDFEKANQVSFSYIKGFYNRNQFYRLSV